MLHIRPFNFYKRDRALFNAVAQNALTSRKLLEIEYGEFPLKGVDITTPDERPISLRGYFADKKATPLGKLLRSAFTLGYVRTSLYEKNKETKKTEPIKFERAIYYNQLINSPLGQAGGLWANYKPLVKGAIFLAQGMGTVAKATATLATVVKHTWFLGLVLLTHARGMLVTQALTMPFRAVMDTIGHEGIHVLQAQQRADAQEKTELATQKHEKAAADVYAQIKTAHDDDKSALYRKLGDMRDAYDQERKGLRDGFNPLGSGMCAGLLSHLSKPVRTLTLAEQVVSGPILPYLRHDAEIQARMHTVLAEGYRNRWHRLPATKDELWAALISSGLKAPASIRQHVAESGEDNVKLFHQPGARGAFNRIAQKCSPHVAEINAAQGSLLTTRTREYFWQDVLPRLYGHLLELYGDKQGQARMGISNESELRKMADIFDAREGHIVRLSEVMQRFESLRTGPLTQDQRILLRAVSDRIEFIDMPLEYEGEQVYVRGDETKPLRDVYVDAMTLADGDDRDVALSQATPLQSLGVLSQCKDYSAEVANGTLTPGTYKKRNLAERLLGINL